VTKLQQKKLGSIRDHIKEIPNKKYFFKKTMNSKDSIWLKKGGIEEKLKFNGQLRINLHKFDQGSK